MPIDPVDNISLQIPALPLDEDRNKLAAIIAAIVSGGDIVGYLPVKSTDNLDGTATPHVRIDGIVFDPNIDIGSVNLLNTSDVEINPATEDKQDNIITELTTLNAVDFATEVTLAAIKAQTDNLNFTGSALDVNLVSGAAVTPEVSTVNSSTTPLGAGANFTGTFEDVLEFGHLTIQVFTDQPSATDGLVVEWSSDGINIDDTDEYNVPANNGKVFTFGPQAKFFRVKYTNGAIVQGAFRLHVVKKPFSQKPSSHRIQDQIVSDDDAELVKAILTGQDENGNFVNVTVTSAGSLLISQEPAPGEISIHRYTRTVVASHPTVLISYTVPVGKKFRLTDWHVATAGAITLTALEIAGVEVDSLRFSASNDTRRIAGIFSEKSGIAAVAGQVVQIRTITGDTAKEWTVGFNGVERVA